MAALIKFLELRKGVLSLELYCMLMRVAIWWAREHSFRVVLG